MREVVYSSLSIQVKKLYIKTKTVLSLFSVLLPKLAPHVRAVNCQSVERCKGTAHNTGRATVLTEIHIEITYKYLQLHIYINVFISIKTTLKLVIRGGYFVTLLITLTL